MKDSISSLKSKISQQELRIIDSETNLRTSQEEGKRLKDAVRGLEDRLGKESESLMRLRLDAKDLEKSNTSFKLSFEAEKEKAELIKRENELLVSFR